VLWYCKGVAAWYRVGFMGHWSELVPGWRQLATALYENDDATRQGAWNQYITTSDAEHDPKYSDVATMYSALYKAHDDQFRFPTVKAETVYDIVKQDGRILMLPVGTIALGTTCDELNVANGLNGVPRDKVTWFGTVRPVVVFAKCT